MVTGVKKLGGTLGSVAAGGLKVFTAGVAAASAGVTVLGKKAVESFADYEQLVGGIETLFGTGGITKVQDYAKSVGKSVSQVKGEFNMLMEAQALALDNANKAYATAGLSANDYMETVTSFAASLKQSCKDELEAAEAANQAVIDMSDNANKMGTDMTMIQNAYQGFAKQNYTMLDNLKLGYGGTKEEMQRLLADAEKLSGIKYDISNLNDVFSAIHVVQEELGITGTTAKEASTTISGSLNMTKAAWSNMLVAMTTDSMDFDTAVNNLVESAAVAAENLLPRIEATLNGMGKLIEALLPVIMARVPAIINDVLPDLIQSGIGMITALVEGIHQNLPQVTESAGEIIDLLIAALLEISPQIIEISVQLIGTLAQGIIENLPKLIEAAGEIAKAILDGIGDLCPALKPVTDAIQMLIDNFDKLVPIVESAIIVFAGLKAGMAIQSAVQGFQQARVAISLFAMQANGASLAQAALNGTITVGETIVALLTGKMTLAQLASAGLAKAQGILNAVMAANPIVLIVAAIAALVAAFIYLWNTNEKFRQFWIDLWESIKSTAKIVIDAIVGFFTETIPAAFNDFVGLLTGIWDAVKEGWQSFIEFITGFVQGIQETLICAWDAIVQFFTETIPQFIASIIEWITQLPENIAYLLGYALGTFIKWGLDLVEWATANIPLLIEKIVTFFSELPGKIATFLSEILSNAIVWGSNMLLNAEKAGREFVTGIINFLSELPGKIAKLLSQILADVIAWANNMLAKAQKAGSDFVNGVVNFVKTLPGKIKEFIDDIIKKVTTFVTDFGNKAKEAGEEFFDRITGALSDLPDKMVEIGGNIISGIWNGISAGWDWLVGKVREVAGSLLGAAEEELDINSPSREFKWIGEMCVAGFDEGIEDLMNPKTMTRNIKASFAAMQSNLPSGGNGKTGGSGGFSQTIIVNREISTADELARAVRVESRYGLMRGVPVG